MDEEFDGYIIGVLGKKGAGKSFAAHVITTWFDDRGIDLSTLAISFLLKPIAAAMFGIKGVDIYSNEAKTIDLTHVLNGEEAVNEIIKVLEKHKIGWFSLGFQNHKFMALTMYWLFCETFCEDISFKLPNKLKEPCTFGRILQIFGTEVVRMQISPSFWAAVTEAKMKKEGGSYIIPDIRFQEEESLIRIFNGVIIKVVNVVGENDPSDGRSLQHASETEMDDIEPDFLVINDMTPNFVTKIHYILEMIHENK